ncbi:hypothetical protein HSHS1_11940 [Helicobacter suis HS1]|nr:hypothetical protein [Helicobacter suis]BDR28433.1 hypothetical protein HSHS1_11940 [Helicobacter suis HS1]
MQALKTSMQAITDTQEAISFGVPSTSTTLSLALGDVLAACLMEVKNFSREDFAKLHPIAYVYAQGYASAEMKHGPIALADCNL